MYVARARIVLLAADGVANSEIAERCGTTRPTAGKWRSRYAEGGIEALGDAPRPGKPSEIDEVAVLAETLADKGKPPPEVGTSHWSARLLADRAPARRLADPDEIAAAVAYLASP